jgi:hypothetical protein
MSKLTFKEWSILADIETIAFLAEDEEFSMARGELKTAQAAITRLMTKLKGEGDLEAWVQSKITKAAEYLDTVADHLSHGEDDTERDEVQEMISTSAMTGKPYRDISNKRDQKDLEKERSKRKKEKEEKYKKSLESLRDQTREKGIRFYDKKGSGYIKDGQKQYDESIELHDANGNLFAHVVDIIRGSDYKFQSLTQPINEDAVEELEVELKKLDNTSYDSIDKLMRNIMKEHDMSAKELHNAFVKKHDKTPDEWVKGLNEKCWDGYKQVGMKKKGNKVVPNCVKEENKSGDSSLRDWFSKSRSSDGTPGWVQLGGKYAGKPCAKQEGQTTKPKCGSSKMKADLSDKEEESAFRRKNQEDPNPDRKGKAKMVATESNNPLMSGMPKPQSDYENLASDLLSHANKVARNKSLKDSRNKHLASQSQTKVSEEKDACYSKVKSRYSVWPSAYASGALVKCRKVGAKNWGNKTKKESFELQEMGEVQRYCPKCKKNETMKECRYGEGYWKMFSIPASLAPDAYDPNDVHPANESLSLKVGSFYKKPIDSVIQPGQLTNEDYQRIQSTGNVYTILFSWRGRPMMNLQLFFPNMRRPSKDEVKNEIEKLYPGAVILQWYPSPTDPSKPIIVIQK